MNNKSLNFIIKILTIALLGCGGTNFPIQGPYYIDSDGSFGKITISWEEMGVDGRVIGYNIYRSTDNINFNKINYDVVEENSYVDDLNYPEDDGILYYYGVTAVGKGEESSTDSLNYNSTANMHGTRPNASYSSGFTTEVSKSPYVVEDSTTISGGDLVIEDGHALYAIGESSISLEQGYDFIIRGLFRTVPKETYAYRESSLKRITITSHKVGSDELDDQTGFNMIFDDAVSYSPSTDEGTLIDSSNITNIANELYNGGNNIHLTNSSPRFYNTSISANSSDGTAFFVIASGSAPQIENCSFNGIVLDIAGALRATNAGIKYNEFVNGKYRLMFEGLDNPAVEANQVELNKFSSNKSVYLFDMIGVSDIPLGLNYWEGGTGEPPLADVTQAGTTTIGIDFSPALYGAPKKSGLISSGY